ncbi:DUF2332 domain-containing protein [Pelagibius sp. Alg239-R121]|uniref:DUF2332 domain-containing protein n=1 Tax=Pelagibius sp. Alg239-R121 TaxID=2993448 RepID=UPI0024A73689|nr:DUF2332 family protein [Pelagibius sp. Alg239-R121]
MPSNEPPEASPTSPPGEAAVRAHFLAQSKSCRSMGSPFTAGLLETAGERLSTSSRIGATVLRWPGTPSDDALALRFAAGLHWLALRGGDKELAELYRERGIVGQQPSSWKLIEQVLERHGTALMRFIERPPQTNEVGRSAVIFGGFMAVAARTGQPLSLREIGSSAGLNLNWHRYGYCPSGIDLQWGDIEGPVVMRPDWEGPVPTLANVEVIDGMGCDLNPADYTAITLSSDEPVPSSDEANRLLAYIWPDQEERMARMRGALRIAVKHPPIVERESAAAWLGRVVKKQPADCAQVVFHTVVWQYLSPDERSGIKDAIDQAAAAATTANPFAWLRMEPSEDGGCAELRLTLWPEDSEIHLADVCYHGKWIRWFGRE